MPRTAILLAVALLASLTACGSRDDARHHDAHPKSTPTAGQGDRYLKAARDMPYTESKPTDQELLDFPPKWCNGLAQGHSVGDLFDLHGDDLYPAGQHWGLKQADANELLVTAVNVYCPDYWKQVTQDIRSNGGL